jgi:hypothetical protein
MIAAFDIGIKNFAFAVKDKGEFILLKNTCLDENIVTKCDLNHHKKKELIEMMNNLNISFTQEKIKKTDIVDLILKNKKKVKLNPKDLGLSLFEIMDTYKDIWIHCDVFLIERQMTINLQALKLSHYLEAYLKIFYSSKKILNYNASTKTKKLGAINLKTKKDRKKWTINYVQNLLTGDNLRYFENLNKQDDIADVICMIESYLI